MSSSLGPTPSNPLDAPGFNPGSRRNEPIRVVLESSGGFLGRWGRWLPWSLLAISVLLNLALLAAQAEYFGVTDRAQEKFHALNKTAKDKVAIIRLRGIISTGEGFIKQQIDAVRADDDVKAVVLRIESPGGSVHGSHYIYHQLRELVKDRKLPLVVSMGGLAASGGYYVAMAAGANAEAGIAPADRLIFAEPTTTTGSIGVIWPRYNIAGFLGEWKIVDDSIKSHPFKDIGSMTRNMTDVERAKLQAYIDDAFARFKDVVCYGRPALKAQQEKLSKEIATGEVFTTNQALKLGLVDAEGYLDDAIQRAIELAGLDVKNVRAVRYTPPPTLMTALGLEAQTPARDPAQALADLAMPQPYYLCTWFPAAALTAVRAEDGGP